MLCKGCKGTGCNIFTSTGYCKCPKGADLKQADDKRFDQYINKMAKK